MPSMRGRVEGAVFVTGRTHSTSGMTSINSAWKHTRWHKAALAKYALQGLPNEVPAAEYKTVLPDEKLIAQELEKTRKLLERKYD